MERLRGYQTLAFLFKRLKFWLNNVLQLVLLLAGFNNNPRHRAAITCRASFVGILAVRQWQDERDNVEHPRLAPKQQPPPGRPFPVSCSPVSANGFSRMNGLAPG